MREHLQYIHRKLNTEDKSKFRYNLSQNERNLPMENKLWTKFKESITQEDIFFYPSTQELVSKIAKHNGVSSSNIMLTPGSDVGIKTLFEVFNTNSKNILTSEYYFPMYKVYADLYQAKLLTARYSGMKLDVEDLLNKIKQGVEFVILSNPNSPIGDYLELEDILRILDTGVFLILDEAYIELTLKPSAIPLIKEYSNLAILRTFSKGLGAAGCRVGYIVSSSSNIEVFSKFRLMYEITGVGTKYISFLLDNYNYFKEYLIESIKAKQTFTSKLKHTSYIDTQTTWLFIKKTAQLEDIFNRNKTSIRYTTLPDSADEWYKFNYDLSIKGTKLEKQVIDETHLRRV